MLDSQSVSALTERCYGIARYVLGNTQETADLAHELVAFILSDEGFDLESPESWRKALNRARTIRRKMMRRERSRRPLDFDIPSRGIDPGAAAELRDELRAVLARLTPDEREALALYHEHGCAEAARLLGITSGALRTRVTRIRQRLR